MPSVKVSLWFPEWIESSSDSPLEVTCSEFNVRWALKSSVPELNIIIRAVSHRQDGCSLRFERLACARNLPVTYRALIYTYS